MPKFVTIGYGDRAGYERTPKDVRDAAHTHDAEIKKRGALIGVAGAPVQVRNRLAAGVKTENSAFMSSEPARRLRFDRPTIFARSGPGWACRVKRPRRSQRSADKTGATSPPLRSRDGA